MFSLESAPLFGPVLAHLALHFEVEPAWGGIKVIADKLNPLKIFWISGSTDLAAGRTPVKGCKRTDVELAGAPSPTPASATSPSSSEWMAKNGLLGAEEGLS